MLWKDQRHRRCASKLQPDRYCFQMPQRQLPMRRAFCRQDSFDPGSS
jgi:hypothetical protein